MHRLLASVLLIILLAMTAISDSAIAKSDVYQNKFPVWKYVTLGDYPDPKSLKEALTVHGHKVFYQFTSQIWNDDELDRCESLFTQTEYTDTRTKLPLTLVSVTELGFNKPVSLRQIYNRAEELGLKRCSFEIAANLRIQTPDQTSDDWTLIATENIDYLYALVKDYKDKHVNYKNDLVVLVRVSYDGGQYQPDCRFVFLLSQ